MIFPVQFRRKGFPKLATYLVWGERGAEGGRVAWTAARNLPTDDPELAGRFMWATAAQNERVEKPVYHLVLSFGPEDPSERAVMEHIVDRVLERLGLAEHQALLVAHRDRPHAHVHVLVNRVHPRTGRSWSAWQDWPPTWEVLRKEERALGIPPRERPERGPTPPLHDLKGPIRGRRGRVANINQLARDLRAYERVVELTREQYAAEIGASGTSSRTRKPGLPIDRAAAWQGRLRAELHTLPDQATLERRIGSLLHYLWPREVRVLRAILTTPQFALARQLRRTARELALGREEERRGRAR